MQKQKKKAMSIVAGITCLGVFATCFIANKSGKFLISTKANNPYVFNFNSGINPLDFDETSISARTLDGNSIVFSYNGLSYSDGDFASFSENASFFNPKLDSEHQNKISGISSIRVVYNSESKLSLSYGWLINEEYEFVSHQINSNEDYDFNGFFPSYFKLSNPNNNSIIVKSISISYSCSEQDPHVHSWGDENIITRATCEHAGMSEYLCSVCGESKEVITPPLSNTGEHTYGDFVILQEPTCVDSGLKRHVCEVCGDDEEIVVPATGVHTYSEWIIDSEPSYTSSGMKHHVCSVCGNTEYEEIEQLISVYLITLDLGNNNIDYVYVGQTGEYSIQDPVREGYNFVKWIDGDNNDFNSNGIVSENKTIYAVWEIDDTDTFAKLSRRCYSGVDYIKITNNLIFNEPVFVKGNVTIYSDKDISLTRSPSFAGDMFVVGENLDGTNPIIDGESPSTLNFGFDGFENEITIDGNRNNVSVDVCGSLLYINNSSTVNIYNGIKFINNNKVSNSRVLNFYDSLFYQRLGGAGALVVNGNLNMYGGLFDGNSVNLTDLSSSNEQIPSFYASYGGTIASVSNFNMFGGTISNSQAARGGALYLGGQNVLDSGTISSNKSFGVGGAIYAYNSDATEISLGKTTGTGYSLKFLNNESTSNGGAIYAMEQVNFHIYGHTLFDGNYSNSNGGAIFSASRLVMSPETANNVSFANNTARLNGGACYFSFDAGDGEQPIERFTIRIVRVSFESNSATNGGAIYGVGANLYLNFSSFVNNHASSIGGAIYGVSNEDNVSTKFYTSVVTFRSNTANEGGAVFLDKNCILQCSSSQVYFYSNSSTNNGGAISSHGGIIDISSSSINNAVFEDNEAGGNGGAIYLSYRSNSGENPDPAGWDSSATLKNISFNSNEATLGGVFYITTKIYGHNSLSAAGCLFDGNSSSSHGGVLSVMNATTSFDTCTFQRNISDGRGGVIYSSSSTISTSLSEFIENNSGSAGAIALYGSDYSSNSDIFEDNINRAIYLDSSSAEIANSEFTSNSTTGNGGAINVADSNCSLTIQSSNFANNTASGNGGAIMISSGDVTISNSEFTSNVASSDTYGGGAIYATGATMSVSESLFESNSATNGGAIAIYSNTSLTVDGVTAYSNSASSNGGFIYIRNSSMNTANSASVSAIGAENKGNTAEYGGAISVSVSSSNWSSTTVLDNFNIFHNESTVAGGAVYVNGSSTTFNVSNSTISNNASVAGGAMYFDSQTSVELTNTTLSYNSSTNNGGAIYVIPAFNSKDVVVGHATITVSGCTFDHNSSGTEGGAIYARETTVLTISSTVFSYNTSTTTGGVLSSHGAIVTISGGEFSNNSSNTNGGALYLSYTSSGSYDSNFTINGTLFDSNTASYGGAIYMTSKVQYQGRCELISCTFTNNESSASGGAITSSSSTLIIDGMSNYKTTFQNNNATSNGGAIYSTGSDIDIDYCIFFENTSSKSGGSVYLSNCADVNIDHTQFNNNESGTTGGAIYASGSSISTSNSEFNNNVSDANGGAIYLTSSSLNLTTVRFVGNYSTSGNGGAMAEHTNSSIVINGVTAYDNSASNGYGGFAYVKNSTLSTANNASKSYIGLLIGDVQHGNTALSGGAISLSGASGQSIEFTNVEMNYNIASNGNGGAIILEDASTAYLINCALAGNTSSSSGGSVYLAEGTSLSTTNCSYTNNSITSGNGGAIYSYGASITASNCSFLNNTTTGNGGAIACERSSTKVEPDLTITNCTFDSNSAVNGGAIYADYTTFVFNSGSLVDNVATTNGGAIYIRYSTMDIYSITATGNTANSGGVFYVNRTTMAVNSNGNGTVIFGTSDSTETSLINSASSGGVIYATIGSDITINNATFGYNTATNGGAITATHDSGNTMVLSNCLFIGNKATGTSYGGGAIYAVGASNMTINSCTFNSNNAKYGGAIYANSSAPITIIDSTFTNNTSTSGAAIYVTGSTEVEISSSAFNSNTATSNGGAIYTDSNSIMTIDLETELSNNIAKNGGAIYIIGSASVTINDSLISSNEATTHGGGIYISETAVLSVTDTTISSNIAANNGGGAYLYTNSTLVSFTNCIFDSNVATSGNGGAIYAANSCSIALTGITGTNNTASNGYGGFAGVTTNVNISIKGLTLSGNSAKTGANFRINSSNVTVIVNKSYSYSLNGSSLSTENQIKTMFSLASGTVINYETNA